MYRQQHMFTLHRRSMDQPLMRVGVLVIALALLWQRFLNRGDFFAFVNPAKKSLAACVQLKLSINVFPEHFA
jgi:hypothetical protein